MQPKADAARLASLIRAHAPYDGAFELRMPGIHAIKVSHPSTAVAHALQGLAAAETTAA